MNSPWYLPHSGMLFLARWIGTHPGFHALNARAPKFRCPQLLYLMNLFKKHLDGAPRHRRSRQKRHANCKKSPPLSSPAKLRGQRVFTWLIAAGAALLVLITFWAAAPNRQSAVTAVSWVPISQTLGLEDATLIPDSDSFRLATTADFDPDAISWLHTSGRQVSGEIPGAYSGVDKSDAYVLIGKNDMRRVLIIVNGKVRCDAQYKTVALAVRVPRNSIEKIDWSRTPGEPDGDGLFIVSNASSPGSGIVLFLSWNADRFGNPNRLSPSAAVLNSLEGAPSFFG